MLLVKTYIETLTSQTTTSQTVYKVDSVYNEVLKSGYSVTYTYFNNSAHVRSTELILDEIIYTKETK